MTDIEARLAEAQRALFDARMAVIRADNLLAGILRDAHTWVGGIGGTVVRSHEGPDGTRVIDEVRLTEVSVSADDNMDRYARGDS